MNNITIEGASISDSEQILSLQKLAYQSEAETYNDCNIEPLVQTLELLQKQFEDHMILKAVLDDMIIGSVRANEQDGTCYIGKLMVHPDHQNLGIGKMLMSSIERHFPNCRYELFTGSKSEKNITLYKKLGYKAFHENFISSDLSLIYMEKRGI